MLKNQKEQSVKQTKIINYTIEVNKDLEKINMFIDDSDWRRI